MKKPIVYCLIFPLVFCLCASLRETQAAPYYEGKRLKVLVGFSPGGGYDRMARLLAKHLPKYIPGKPTVVIENMEGASSMLAANHTYNIAKADGLTVTSFARGLFFAQLTKAEGVKFDSRKFSWIGSPAVEAIVLTLRTDIPYRTVDDLKKAKEPIPLAGMGAATTDTQFGILLKEFVGLNLRMILYPSSAEGMLAIERKEVDGRSGSYSSLKPYIQRGLVRPILRGRVSEPGIEQLPVSENLATDQKGKTILGMFTSVDQMGRPYVAPPGTPAEIMTILRDAFAKTTRDPGFLDDAKKAEASVQFTPADECMKTLNEFFNQPDEIVREFSKYIKF